MRDNDSYHVSNRNVIEWMDEIDQTAASIFCGANDRATGSEGAGTTARMAGDGRGGVFGEHAAGAEGGRGDIPGVLRGARRVVSPGGSDDHPRVYRARGR